MARHGDRGSSVRPRGPCRGRAPRGPRPRGRGARPADGGRGGGHPPRRLGAAGLQRPALPVPGRRRRLPREPGARAPGRRHGLGQDRPGHRRHGPPLSRARHRPRAHRLPRFAQAPVGPRDRPLFGGAGRRRHGRRRRARAAHGAVRQRARGFDHQLRAVARRREGDRPARARPPGAGRGPAHQELADAHLGRGQARADATRLRADRHSAREPPRRPLQFDAGGRPAHPGAAVALQPRLHRARRARAGAGLPQPHRAARAPEAAPAAAAERRGAAPAPGPNRQPAHGGARPSAARSARRRHGAGRAALDHFAAPAALPGRRAAPHARLPAHAHGVRRGLPLR